MLTETRISATPILDSGVLPPRRQKTLLGFFIGVVIGLLFLLVITKVGNSQSQSDVAAFAYFLILGVSVVIHELGHLVAGWLVGFHFNSISIGPLVFGFEYGRIRIRFRQGKGALGFAGMHIDRVRKLHRRLLIFTIGGPAANLMSAAATVLMVTYVFPSSGNTWVAPVAAGFVYLSLFLGVIGFLPLWPKSRSDGTRIWMLLTSNERTRRLISTMALANQSRRGIPLKSWKRTWLNAAILLRDASFDEFTSNWIAFAAASSRKDLPALTTHLERCLELAYLLSISQRDEIAREAGIFAAWFRNDAVAADKWFTQIKHPKQTTKIMQIRVRIALDCARREFNSAFDGLHEGSGYIESLPETPFRTMLKESWAEWTDEVKERQNQTTNV